MADTSGFGPFGPCGVATNVQTTEVLPTKLAVAQESEHLRAADAIGGR